MFPDQSLERSATAAERMRQGIGRLAIPHPGREPGAVLTVSAGIACYDSRRGDDVEKLLSRAETALLAAKEAGRNRVVSRVRAALRSAI